MADTRRPLSGAENCFLSMSGYGSVRTHIDSLRHGMDIIGGEDRARNHREFYSRALTSGTFSIRVLLGASRDAYTYFNSWLLGYARRLAETNGNVGPVRVRVPSRNFDKLGILTRGINFGDNWDEIGRKVTLSFIGGRDPSEFQNPISSRYASASNTSDSMYFYPSGLQLTAGADGDGIYRGDRLTGPGRRPGMPV